MSASERDSVSCEDSREYSSVSLIRLLKKFRMKSNLNRWHSFAKVSISNASANKQDSESHVSPSVPHSMKYFQCKMNTEIIYTDEILGAAIFQRVLFKFIGAWCSLLY